MPLYKFGKNDIITNTIKTHPKQEFFVYSGSIYYQNQNAISGANTSNTYGIPTGYINLFNENVDRKTTSTGRTIGTSGVPDKGIIYPFLFKDSSGFSFKTTTQEQYNTLTPGDIMSGSYFVSSTIGRYFQASTQYDFFTTYYRKLPGVIKDIVTANTGTWDEQTKREFIETYVSKSSPILNLENVLKDYSIFSPHFLMSSSYGDKRYQDITILEIPQLFYGSKIKKGTIELDYYYTGSLVGKLVDNTQNGELIQVSGTITANNGKVAGVVLYNHGMILLTGSWDLVTGVNNIILSSSQAGSSLTSSYNIHKWNHWGTAMPVSSNNRFYERTLFESNNPSVKTAITYKDGLSYTIVEKQQYINTTVLSQSLLDSASYSLSFLGTHRVPTMTMFANAPKGELNWSNNPTFLEYSATTFKPLTGSYFFNEQTKTIKNIVSSSIDNYSASFEKVTYINQVNLYDDMGNLIGIAKTSKPIKKTEDTDFTFKLKLDM